MDVADLAPALLGLSEIVKIANNRFNGDKSAVKVLVSVDSEQKCFQCDIQITQGFFQSISLLLSNEAVATAKEIAEWIGIIGGPGGGVYGLFRLYKWIANKKVSLNELDVEQDGNNVTITNPGDNSNITVNNNTFILMDDKDVLKNIKDVVKPLTNEGYDKLQFEQEEEVTEEISSDEGRRIYNLDADSLEMRPRVHVTTSFTKLKVKKPDLLGDSRWSFILDKQIEAKIEDVVWLEEFQKGNIPLPVGSYLDVMLRHEIELDDNNHPTGNASYYVVDVKGVIPPSEQDELFAPPTPDY